MRLTVVLFLVALVACQGPDAAQEEVEEAVIESATSGGAAMEIEIERIQLEVGDLTFDALAAGPETGELVFMLHGFPQSSYEWRNQIPAVAGMGFRVVAPDQRGYSPGARPEGVAAYAIPNLVADVVGMADALGQERFHVVGHDWGAAVAWSVGLAHPDRVISLVALSVPHPDAFSEALRSTTGDQAQRSRYFQFFASDTAVATFLADDAARLRELYMGGGVLSDEDVQTYLDLLGEPTALQSALNWYGALTLGGGGGGRRGGGRGTGGAAGGAPAGGASAGGDPAGVTPIGMPTMFVWSTEDTALGREGAELTEKYVEGPYRFEIIEGVGHWIPEEAADRLNELLREHFAQN
jgi:pimeloyl-ACP methyl ester carboxylesterase